MPEAGLRSIHPKSNDVEIATRRAVAVAGRADLHWLDNACFTLAIPFAIFGSAPVTHPANLACVIMAGRGRASLQGQSNIKAMSFPGLGRLGFYIPVSS